MAAKIPVVVVPVLNRNKYFTIILVQSFLIQTPNTIFRYLKVGFMSSALSNRVAIRHMRRQEVFPKADVLASQIAIFVA
jgi:hypothetical protein